jgi:transcriptional regulator of acetoin/glycerol metabolism
MAHTTEQLVIVRRNQFATFALLAKAFADEPNIRFIWDRRTGDRRGTGTAATGGDRRSGDRRGDPAFTWGTNEYMLLTLSDRKSAAPLPFAAPADVVRVSPEHEQLVRDMGRDLDSAADSDLSVLLSGGDAISRKSLARWIHRRSDRAAQPLVVVDSPAFADSQAGSRDEARAQALTGGTLFIEEIGHWTWRQQSDLVRFIERAARPQTPNGRTVRLISGTECWLLDRVAAREFRPDLFYRLNAIHLVLPAGRRAQRVDNGIAIAR